MPALSPYNRPDYNNLPSQFPPDCASAWGEDQYGIWFDLNVAQAVQRFRWVPKGQFMMGSTDDEVDRDSNESYHAVTLTQGYWLADTACTQALWQSVSDNNPAHFTDDLQNPVEKISWLDIQGFLVKINQMIPNLNAQLPSEAQWEYACRAGTVTPFTFGENVTPDLVNYDGNNPYANGDKGESRQKTLPVKALTASQWGLYQMHGNVWEWCFDEFESDLGKAAVTNPVHGRFKPGTKPEKAGTKRETETAETVSSLKTPHLYTSEMLVNAEDTGVVRVLRGGSWNIFGSDCRSAFRDWNKADIRHDSTGFRLSLGL